MTHHLHDDFADDGLNPYWTPYTVGNGSLDLTPGQLTLNLPAMPHDAYVDAQISDTPYRLPRHKFRWQPPLRMSVRAKASAAGEALKGTAGFGFWNEPLRPGKFELPQVPRALWFFFSGAQNNMALAEGVPGHGWKAAVFDAANPRFWGLLPFAPVGFLLMRQPALYQRFWPVGQAAVGVDETLLSNDLLADWHDYEIEWLPHQVTFYVDSAMIMQTSRSPRGPLGFIAWMDNRWAVVTPQGRFGFGVNGGDEQWLGLNHIIIERLASG